MLSFIGRFFAIWTKNWSISDKTKTFELQKWYIKCKTGFKSTSNFLNEISNSENSRATATVICMRVIFFLSFGSCIPLNSKNHSYGHSYLHLYINTQWQQLRIILIIKTIKHWCPSTKLYGSRRYFKEQLPLSMY